MSAVSRDVYSGLAEWNFEIFQGSRSPRQAEAQGQIQVKAYCPKIGGFILRAVCDDVWLDRRCGRVVLDNAGKRMGKTAVANTFP